ncbi:hypothetical protein [Nocardia sp. MW-W600-9]
MLITALVLALVGVFRRRLRGVSGDPGPVGRRLAVVAAATRRAGERLLGEPVPALSAVVAVMGLTLVGSHLACSGMV